MISISDEHLHMLTSILAEYIPADATVYAFGSRIKGVNRKYSDLDITIKAIHKMPDKTMMELKEALMDSDIPFRIDISEWQNLSNHFKHCIEDELLQIDI